MSLSCLVLQAHCSLASTFARLPETTKATCLVLGEPEKDDEKESADDGLKEDTKAAPESEEADQSLEKEGKSSASAELKDKDDKEEKEEREEKDEKDEKEDGEDRGETEDKDQKEEKAMRESEGEEEDNADTLNPESAEAKDDKESRQDSKDSGDKQEGEETEKEEDGDEEKSQSTEAMMKQSDKELLQELVAAAKWANREEAKPKTAGEDTESTASPHRKKEQNKHGQDPPVPADEPHDFRDEDLVESELEETMLPKKKPSGRGNRQERATHPQKHSKPATAKKHEAEASSSSVEADAEQEKPKSEEGLKPSDRELLQELVAAAKLSSAKEEAKRNASHAASAEDRESKAPSQRPKEQKEPGEDQHAEEPAGESSKAGDEDSSEDSADGADLVETEENSPPSKKASRKGGSKERASQHQKHSKSASVKKIFGSTGFAGTDKSLQPRHKKGGFHVYVEADGVLLEQ
ncbi:unnamed protein product, partial [Symbiodinium necroappetens]